MEESIFHYKDGHEGDPAYIVYESWFLQAPEYLDAVRVSSYVDWIYEIIVTDGDLTGDDWVDFQDFARYASQWQRDDCNEQNSWCDGANFLEPFGIVDLNDLSFLTDNWLTGWQF